MIQHYIKQPLRLILLPAFLVFAPPRLSAHPDAAESGTNQPPNRKESRPGGNVWNEAQEPADWWGEIKRVHGHVGPWNVLGWRVGKAALRELGAGWGRHELDIVCHVPLETPYSCLADGLIAGTGNSLGRLDLRLAEVMSVSDIHVSVRRKDGTGAVLLFKPRAEYLEKIHTQPVENLEALARESGQLPESKLFEIEKFQQIDRSAKSLKPARSPEPSLMR